MAALVIDTVDAYVTASIELSTWVQQLVMGIHGHDYIVGSDTIFIMKELESDMKVDAQLSHLIKHKGS